MSLDFDTERFIKEMKNRPCLWDTAAKDYVDRNVRKKCWDEMVNLFKEEDEITVQEKEQLAVSLQKRWKGIRGCYTRELLRKKSGKYGSRKSEYTYFKQLQFLQKVVFSIRDPDPAAATQDSAADPLENPEDDSQNSRKRQKTNENTESDIGNDEDRLFLLSLVETLKRVPPHRKIATKIKIMSVLDEETRTVPPENAQNIWYWSQTPGLKEEAIEEDS